MAQLSMPITCKCVNSVTKICHILNSFAGGGLKLEKLIQTTLLHKKINLLPICKNSLSRSEGKSGQTLNFGINFLEILCMKKDCELKTTVKRIRACIFGTFSLKQ